MKGALKNIIKLFGVEWMVKTVLLSGLEALREAVIESETTWDDRIVLNVIDGMIEALKTGSAPGEVSTQ